MNRLHHLFTVHDAVTSSLGRAMCYFLTWMGATALATVVFLLIQAPDGNGPASVGEMFSNYVPLSLGSLWCIPLFLSNILCLACFVRLELPFRWLLWPFATFAVHGVYICLAAR
ncbi:hypothetical protein OpiT1DRAFT_03501 [Opitutaceae bacterium TAV1]|nr:hypothetical protein OpiT1DRAFT_03501 [Opitutaceae bacterium TAV1]